MSDPIQDIIDKAGLGFRDYIVCALWSSVYCGPKEGPDAPEYMDDEVGIYDFDPETFRKLADEYRRQIGQLERIVQAMDPTIRPQAF